MADLNYHDALRLGQKEYRARAAKSRSRFGLFRLLDGQRELLARPVWNWGAYYEQILRRMHDKTVQTEYESSSKALNYYWGVWRATREAAETEQETQR